MMSFKCIGDMKSSKPFHRVEKLFFGGLNLKIFQQALKISCSIGEHKIKRLKVTNITIIVISKSESKVILSPIDYLYLNTGQSFIWQDKPFGKYITWR